MQNGKNTPSYIVKWWLWNSKLKTFEQHELTAQQVNISRCPKYRFFRAENPVNPDCRKPGQDWIIAEGGTGYILAYGPNRDAVLLAARGRFQLEKEGIREVDVTQYIGGHLGLLKRYVGNSPHFILPAPGTNIVPVLKPDQILITQMI